MDVLELHEAAYDLLDAGLSGGTLQEVAGQVKALVAAVPADQVARLLTVVVVEACTRNVSTATRGVMQARVGLARQRLDYVREKAAGDPLADVLEFVPRGRRT